MEIGTSSIDWAQLRQYPVSETLCVLNKNKMMDNVQKHKHCINIITCRVVRATKMTGSTPDDWIY
jgi:hypothetical protein